MKNYIKIVCRVSCSGNWMFSGVFNSDSNDRCKSMLDLALKANLSLVKFCRDTEIMELYRDKHNNYIYREYEKE